MEVLFNNLFIFVVLLFAACILLIHRMYMEWWGDRQYDRAANCTCNHIMFTPIVILDETCPKHGKEIRRDREISENLSRSYFERKKSKRVGKGNFRKGRRLG